MHHVVVPAQHQNRKEEEQPKVRVAIEANGVPAPEQDPSHHQEDVVPQDQVKVHPLPLTLQHRNRRSR
jgi:hypothetical protein